LALRNPSNQGGVLSVLRVQLSKIS